MSSHLNKGQPIQVWALRKELGVEGNFTDQVKRVVGRAVGNFTVLTPIQANRVRQAHLLELTRKELGGGTDFKKFVRQLAHERGLSVLDVLRQTPGSFLAAAYRDWRDRGDGPRKAEGLHDFLQFLGHFAKERGQSLDELCSQMPESALRSAYQHWCATTRGEPEDTSRASSESAPDDHKKAVAADPSKASTPGIEESPEVLRQVVPPSPATVGSGGFFIRRRTRRRAQLGPRHDRTLSTAPLTATTLVTAFGVMVAWIAWPTGAEWLVTWGTHGLSGVLLVGLIIIAVLPTAPADGRGLRRIMASVTLAFMRGAAVGTASIIVLPRYGDLWNRWHEMAWLLIVASLCAAVRPWDPTGLPARLVIGFWVRHPRLWRSDRLTIRIIDRIRTALSSDHSPPSVKVTADRIQLDGVPPQWFTLALESRLNRLGSRLSRAVPRSEPASIALESERRAFDELALGELDLARLAIVDAREADRLLDVAINRVASSLDLSLRSGIPLTLEPGRVQICERERVVERLKTLWDVARRSLGESAYGVRFLAAACRSTAPDRHSKVFRTAFEGNIGQLSGTDLRLTAVGMALLAVTLQDESLLGWSEGLCRRTLAILSLESRADDPVVSLVETVKGRSLARQLPFESIEQSASLPPEDRRIAEDSVAAARASGDLRLAEALPIEATGLQASNPLPTFRMASRTSACGIRLERRGLHGSIPPAVRGIGAAVSAAVLIAMIWVDWNHAHIADPLVRISDPFRPAMLSPVGREISATSVDLQSGDLLLASDVGLHTFDPDHFRHATESIGPGGPAASIRRLAPDGGGGTLVEVGSGPSGVQWRSPTGDWSDLIGLPELDLDDAIVDMIREDGDESLLLLTSDRILRYREDVRRLEDVEIRGQQPSPPFVDWTSAGPEIVVLCDSGLHWLRRSGSAFESRAIEIPTSLGSGAEVAAVEDAVFVRTSRDALIRTSLSDEPEWDIVAGGRQFDDSARTGRLKATALGSDGLLVVFSGAASDEVRIRQPDDRHWRSTPLPRGVRIGELPPMLSPDGRDAVVVDSNGGLWLITESADLLRLEHRRLQEGAIVTSLAEHADGFSLVLDRGDRREIRVGTWAELSEAGTRVQTLRPLDLRGGIESIVLHPTDPNRAFMLDSEGGLSEYDRLRRTMVGDRLQLKSEDGQGITKVASITWFEDGLAAVISQGETRRFPDPTSLPAGSVAGELRATGIGPLTATARPPSGINSLRDIPGGFEIIDDRGQAWAYDLASGWSHTSANLESPIIAGSLIRLQSGHLAGRCEDGRLVWRDARSWRSAAHAIQDPVICTDGLAGFDADRRLIRMQSVEAGRPMIEVLHTPIPRPDLIAPFNDAQADAARRRLFIAHEGGLASYDIDGPAWATIPIDGTAARRLEVVDDDLFVETEAATLFRVRMETLEAEQALENVRSWTLVSGGILAVDGSHQLHRVDDAGITTIIQSQPGIRSERSLDATCAAGHAWVLEDSRLWRIDSAGRVTSIDLPGGTSGARMLAAVGGIVHVLTKDVVQGFDAIQNRWLPPTVRECRQLVEFPGVALAITSTGRVLRIDRDGRVRTVLPGGVESRRIDLASERTRFLEDADGVWISNGSDLLRWGPDGLGSVLKDRGDGRLQSTNGQMYVLTDSIVRRIGEGPLGLTTQPVSNAPASQVIQTNNGLLLVMGNALHKSIGEGRDATTVPFRFGVQGAITGDPIDLVSGNGAEAFILTDEGEVLRYDNTRRQLSINDRTDIRSTSARLHTLADGTRLVIDEASQRADLLTPRDNQLLDSLASCQMLDGEAFALTTRGRLATASEGRWTSIGPDRPGFATPQDVEDHAPLGRNDRLLLLDRGNIRWHRRGEPGVRTLDIGIDSVASISPLPDGRVLAKASEDERVSDDQPARVVFDGGGSRAVPTGILIEGPDEPQVISSDLGTLKSLDGEVLWTSRDRRIDVGRVVQLIDDAAGPGAFVMDEDGTVGKVSTIGARFSRIDAIPPVPEARLVLDRTNRIATIHENRIHRADGVTLVAATSARDETVLPLARGVLWLDAWGRLHLDRDFADDLLPAPTDEDRLPFDRASGWSAIAFDVRILRDENDTWVLFPGDIDYRRLDAEIEIDRRDRISVPSNTDRAVLFKQDGTVGLVSGSRIVSLPDPPAGTTLLRVPMGESLFAVGREESTLHRLRVDTTDRGWRTEQLDPEIPDGIRQVQMHPRDGSGWCIAPDGTIWRRVGLRTWSRVASGRVSERDPLARYDFLLEPGAEREGPILIESDGAGPRQASIMLVGRLRPVFERQNEGTLLRGPDGGALATLAFDLASPPTIDDTEWPEDVDPESRSLAESVLKAMTNGAGWSTVALSESGLLEGRERIAVDPLSSEVRVIRPGDSDGGTLVDRPGESWATSTLEELSFEGRDGWVNFGPPERSIWIREFDGLKQTRAPRGLARGINGRVRVIRNDGSSFEITVPVEVESSEPSFRLASRATGDIQYRSPAGWRLFRSGSQPVAEIDRPRSPDSILHGAQGTWWVDRNQDPWFQRAGARFPEPLAVSDGARVSRFAWAVNDAGNPVPIARTSDTRVLRLDLATTRAFAPSAPPSTAPPTGTGLEWADGGIVLFDGRPTRLQGDYFDHETPVDLVARDGVLWAGVDVDGMRYQRRLNRSNGTLQGPLQTYQATTPVPLQTASTPMGTLAIDRGARRIRVETPALAGPPVIDRWTPRSGPASVERIERFGEVADGWIHCTPGGAIIGTTADFDASVVLAQHQPGSIRDLRPAGRGVVDVLLADGTIQRFNGWRSPPAPTPRSVSAFRDGAPGFERAGLADLTRVAFSKIGDADDTAPSSATWSNTAGSFTFELPASGSLETIALVSEDHSKVSIETQAGRLTLDADGTARRTVSLAELKGPSDTRRTGGGGITLSRRNFATNPGAAGLNFDDERNDPLTVPWNVIDGLLPHRAAIGVAPDGDAAAVFVRLGVAQGVTGNPGRPAIRFDRLADEFELRLTGDMSSWNALTDAGVVSRDQSGRVSPNADTIGDGTAVQIRTLTETVRIRRLESNGRRGFELRLRGGDDLSHDLQLTESGFLLDSLADPLVDDAGFVTSSGATLLRRLPGTSAVDALILGRREISDSLRREFQSPVRSGLFLRSRSGEWSLITRDAIIPGQVPVAGAEDLGLQPLLGDGLPSPRSFRRLPDIAGNRRIEWNRGADSAPRILVERGGIFDHDRFHSLAALDDATGPLLTLGTDAVGWRQASDRMLVDVLPHDFEDTPLTPDEHGQWHARSDRNWRPLVLDLKARIIRLGDDAASVIRSGFETIDWQILWADRPKIASPEMIEVARPSGSTWMPGDLVSSCIVDGDDMLLGTDRGVRMFGDDEQDRVALNGIGPNPVPVATSLGTALRDDETWVRLENGRPRRLDGAQRIFESQGRQLSIRIEPDHEPELRWREDSGRPSALTIEVPWPCSSLPGDHVISLTSLGVAPDDRLAAITPLGLFDAARPAGPWPGFSLQDSTRRLGRSGVLLDATNQPVLDVDGPGGFRIDDAVTPVRFNFDPAFEDASAWAPIFDDPAERWLLSMPPGRTSATDLALRDRRRGLETDARTAIVDGQLRFDHVLSVGSDQQGPWVLTDLAVERMVKGELTPTPLSSPEHAPWRMAAAVEIDPNAPNNLMLQVGELSLVVAPTEIVGPTAAPIKPRVEGERIFKLPQGLFVIGPGGIEWVRNQRKWFP